MIGSREWDIDHITDLIDQQTHWAAFTLDNYIHRRIHWRLTVLTNWRETEYLSHVKRCHNLAAQIDQPFDCSRSKWNSGHFLAAHQFLYVRQLNTHEQVTYLERGKLLGSAPGLVHRRRHQA
jgi:hypothetical protein